jgi:hypothetical protein
MKFRAHFYQLNDDFSQEYADTHNNGESSELNRKFDWEDELSLKNDIKTVDVQENTTYVLAGELNGESFSEEIAGMTVFQMNGVDGSATLMACSTSMLNRFEIQEEADEIVLKVYINDYEPYANPIPGIYIASQEFPKKLIVD